MYTEKQSDIMEKSYCLLCVKFLSPKPKPKEEDEEEENVWAQTTINPSSELYLLIRICACESWSYDKNLEDRWFSEKYVIKYDIITTNY